jgi:hypothetical protein
MALNVLMVFSVIFLGITAAIYFGGRFDQNPGLREVLQIAVKWLYADGDFALQSQPWYLVFLNLLAPFILPVLGVFAFVDSLRLRVWLALRRFFSFLGSRNLVVIAGLGDKGFEILQSACHDGHDVIVIEQDPENTYIREAQALGAIVWIGDASTETDVNTACWRRPRRIWIMTGSTDVNLVILDQVNKSWIQLPRA